MGIAEQSRNRLTEKYFFGVRQISACVPQSGIRTGGEADRLSG